MKFTPEDLQKLATKQLANVIRKLNSGKTLTAREEALLAQARAGDEAQPATSGYAKTWDELAKACGVDRRTLTNLRQQHGNLCPADRADGRKEIAAWLRFLEEHDVKGRGSNNPDFIDERALKLGERQFKLEKARFELERAKAAVLPVAEYQAGLTIMIGQFRAQAQALPGRAATKILQRARAAVLRMLQASLPAKTWERVAEIVQTAPIDFAEIEEQLESEVGNMLAVLEACEYLAETPEAEE